MIAIVTVGVTLLLAWLGLVALFVGALWASWRWL